MKNLLTLAILAAVAFGVYSYQAQSLGRDARVASCVSAKLATGNHMDVAPAQRACMKVEGL